MRVLIIALVGLTLVGCAHIGDTLDTVDQLTWAFDPATNFLEEE